MMALYDRPPRSPPLHAGERLATFDRLARLNSRQREAAQFGVDRKGGYGPLLVIAGAGSGKTATLAHRVACLLAAGVSPPEILLLTFSRRAAREMLRRVEHLVASPAGSDTATLPWAGTFHSIGARLLREYAPRIGVRPEFTIHDREDSADLMGLVRQEALLAETEKRFPMKGTCLAIYSRTVNTETPLGEVLASSFPWCAAWESQLRALFADYVAAKQAQGVLDYDDLLLYWASMMTEASIAEELGHRFRHVLVDEYQDTNRLQASLLLALKPDGRGLTVVGDDAQSIYAFRGATVRNILEFPSRFDPPAAVITLEQNYRSSPEILAAANAVIALAAERFTKNLYSERPAAGRPLLLAVADEGAQARYVADQVLARREEGLALRVQAVLFRASHHSLQVELELSRRNIPFVKFGGLKFLEAAHVKDLLACLRWVQNPRDRVAGLRVLLLVPGVGPRIASRILEQMAAAPDPAAVLARFPGPPAAAGSLDTLSLLLSALRADACPWPDDLARMRRWYEPLLARRYEDAAVRASDLQAIEHIAATYRSREQFLTELTLDPPDATSDEARPPSRDEDYLTLSTIHSAKGREWDAVYILNVVDGCLPSDLAAGTAAEIEEERRLLYVAMTRARDHLQLIIPQRFYVHAQPGEGDRHVYASRSRFIARAVEACFDSGAWREHAPATQTARPAGAPVIDLAARMRTMWR